MDLQENKIWWKRKVKVLPSVAQKTEIKNTRNRLDGSTTQIWRMLGTVLDK